MKRAIEVLIEVAVGIGVGGMIAAGMWFLSSCDVVDIIVVTSWVSFTAGGIAAGCLEYLEDEAKCEAKADKAREAA